MPDQKDSEFIIELKKANSFMLRRINAAREDERNRIYKLINKMVFDVEHSSDYLTNEKNAIKSSLRFLQKKMVIV